MITYQALRQDDAEAVQVTARIAWHVTYAQIFGAPFIDQFVANTYAPEHVRALMPRVAAGELFFDLALDGTDVVGFCNIGLTPDAAELWRIYLDPLFIGRGIGSALLRRGEAFVRGHGRERYDCFVHSANALGY